MKQYIRQAWNLIRQEKLFSAIYIIGTGLSIAIVMVLSIVLYIRFANIYPETNRDRTLTVKSATVKNIKDNGAHSSSLSLNMIDICLRPLSNVEAMTAIWNPWGTEYYVQPTGTRDQLPVTIKHVDTGFWKVFAFRFLNGSPFSVADFESGILSAVISETMANRIFGTTDAVGRYITINFMQYRVCGVVQNTSPAAITSYAQIWIPYTIDPNHKNSYGEGNLLGDFTVFMLAASKPDISGIRNEVLANVQKINNSMSDDFELMLLGQPDTYLQSTFRMYSNHEPNMNKIVWTYGLVFLILFLIPGISLSGMIDSRMERRLTEMGIRRAFGAPAKTLIQQVFMENFLFTLLGGIVGLILSYLVILLNSSWIMALGQNSIKILPDGESVIFSPSMLFNIPVFLIALGVCFLLNILTAFIPAWHSAHREIILSLNVRK